MGKANSKKGPARALPTPLPKRRLRLEGDQLFIWAKLSSAVEQAVQNLEGFGRQCLAERRLDINTYGIDPEGYILTPEERTRQHHQHADAGHNSSESTPPDHTETDTASSE